MGKAEAIEDALDYLSTGGMGEVIGFASLSYEMGAPKVYMDTNMALALCQLASEALDIREKKMREGMVAVPVRERQPDVMVFDGEGRLVRIEQHFNKGIKQ